MLIELNMIGPGGIIRSPFMAVLEPNIETQQYALRLKWGYAKEVQVKGTWSLLMRAIKAAVEQSGVTVVANSNGQRLQGTDEQVLTLLECVNPNIKTWSPDAQKWRNELTHANEYVITEETLGCRPK